MNNFTALVKSQALDMACSDDAQTSLSSTIGYINSLRTEYCPLPVPTPAGNCSLEGVRNCLKEYGQFQALASPYQNVCG